MPEALPDAWKNTAHALRAEGLNNREIAERLGEGFTKGKVENMFKHDKKREEK